MDCCTYGAMAMVVSSHRISLVQKLYPQTSMFFETMEMNRTIIQTKLNIQICITTTLLSFWRV